MSYIDDHYDELVSQYADPESRTRERLRPVFVATVAALIDVSKRADEVFGHVNDDIFGGPQVEQSWRNDLARTLDRMNGYLPQLVPPDTDPGDFAAWGDLDPAGLVPDVYDGLIVSDGEGDAGPVPDAAMPFFLADQLTILDEHVEDLSEAWLLTVLSSIPEWIAEKTEDIIDAADEAADVVKDNLKFLLGGAALLLGLGVAYKLLSR